MCVPDTQEVDSGEGLGAWDDPPNPPYPPTPHPHRQGRPLRAGRTYPTSQRPTPTPDCPLRAGTTERPVKRPWTQTLPEVLRGPQALGLSRSRNPRGEGLGYTEVEQRLSDLEERVPVVVDSHMSRTYPGL